MPLLQMPYKGHSAIFFVIAMATKATQRFLSLLSELTVKQLRPLIANLTRKQLLGLRETTLNLLEGRLELKPEDLKKLKPHRKFLHKLAYSGVKRCALNRHCRVLLNVLKAARSVIDSL